MAKLIKNKIVTGMVVGMTLLLAGVAIFTALRLYQLRQSISPTSPESKPSAWDCSKYVFSISPAGVVSVSNQSSRNEPSQKAKVLINGSLVATLNVPALNQGQNATLGTVTLPSGSVKWEVQGTLDCKSSGEFSAPKACQGLSFALAQASGTPTVTPRATLTPTLSITPKLSATVTLTLTPTLSPSPTGGTGGGEESPTPSPTNAPTQANSPTPTTVQLAQASSTPTVIAQVSPTSGHIAQITQPSGGDGGTDGGVGGASGSTGGRSGGVGGTGSEQLPQAGYDLPTIVGVALGILLIIGAFILAI